MVARGKKSALAGLLFDRTGSHDIVWLIAILPGVIAMAFQLPINPQPLVRLVKSPA